MGSQSGATLFLGDPQAATSNAEFFASAGSASFQNVSTGNGFHSFSETMCFCAFSFIWIISKAHGISPEVEL
jgi:hypothetical protein